MCLTKVKQRVLTTDFGFFFLIKAFPVAFLVGYFGMFDFLSTKFSPLTMLHDWEYHDPNTGMKDQNAINRILKQSQKLSMSDISQVFFLDSDFG